MATADRSTRLRGERRFVLYGAPWQTYELLCESVDNYRTRMTYDEGTLEFMAPSQSHEWIKRHVGRTLESFTEELRIPLKSLGSTTWKQPTLKG